MRAKIVSLSQSGGKQILILETAQDIRETVDSIQGGDAEVTLKPWRQKRSKDANAYMWVLIDKLAQRLNIPKVEIYREAIRGISGVSDTVCVPDKAVKRMRDGWGANGIGWISDTMPSKLKGCTNVILYYGSSTYDAGQMKQLIDRIVEECKQQGIETLTPMELAGLRY